MLQLVFLCMVEGGKGDKEYMYIYIYTTTYWYFIGNMFNMCIYIYKYVDL